MEAKEWLSPPVTGRDSIPQVEESLHRQAQVEANRHARRGDVNQVRGIEPDDNLGHAR